MQVFLYIFGMLMLKKFAYAKDAEKNQFVGQPYYQNLFRVSSSLYIIKMRIFE